MGVTKQSKTIIAWWVSKFPGQNLSSGLALKVPCSWWPSKIISVGCWLLGGLGPESLRRRHIFEKERACVLLQRFRGTTNLTWPKILETKEVALGLKFMALSEQIWLRDMGHGGSQNSRTCMAFWAFSNVFKLAASCLRKNRIMSMWFAHCDFRN